VSRAQGKNRSGVNRKLVYATVLVTVLLVALLTFYYLFILPPGDEWTAAIVDQLAVVPSLFVPEFNNTCTQLFTASGYSPRYYAGEDVTIDFYDRLPSKGGRIIIVRAHSSVRTDTSNVDLYTSEVYQEDLAQGRYYDLAVNNHISRAYFNYAGTEYFAVGPSFVSSVMDGEFSQTLVVLMGCKSLNQTSMAEAMVSRGAKAVVGWTGDVTVGDTDTCVLDLLELLLDKSYTLKGAVDKVNGDHPLNGTRLAYYPEEAWNHLVPTRKGGAVLVLLPAMSVAALSVGICPELDGSLRSVRLKRAYPLIWVSTVPLG
jgi:hypothetical protein